MANLPLFVVGPSALLGIIGLIHGGGERPTPSDDWRDATVDVVIPALNEQDNIVRCLASVMRQTLRPRKIVVVDDGSSDATAARAAAFCDFYGIDVLVIKRVNSIGKTATIRDRARALDSDVLFVLDADTVLESNDYLERTVWELYKDSRIASAEGSILPLRARDRRAWDKSPEVRAFVEASPDGPGKPKDLLRRLASAITNTYRKVLYFLLHRVVFRGYRAIFGPVSNPTGCAVAYRRVYLKTLFDLPLLEADLRNPQGIFVGLTSLGDDYRNLQVTGVCARTSALLSLALLFE